MKNFSQIRNEINIQNKSLLTEESQLFGLDETHLIESIDILSKNLILASLITEQISDSEIKEIVDSIPLDVDKLEDYMIQTKNNIVIVNWDGSKASVEVDGKEIDIPGVVNNPEALRGAVEGILQDYPMSEEVTQDDLADVLYNIPTDTKELIGKEFDINGDKLSVDWNSETGSVKVSLNGKSIDINDKAYDLDTLAQAIMKAVGSDSKEKEEPKKDDKPVTDPETKKKLAVLNTIIKPRLIYKYANTSTDRNRVIAALTDYIKTGSDESKTTADLDQRALVDLLFDLVDVLVTNRNLATLVTKNATAASVSESVILEAKKKSKKKPPTEEGVDVKLDMLLKLGLVDQKLYNRAKKALSNKKAAGTVPYLRNLLFDLLDRLISYIKKDPTLYNRIRINVMKEMKGILPTKKDLDEASCAGKKAAEEGKGKEVPESYSRHYFTKEAWLEGFDSWDGTITNINSEEEEMKTFKEFNETFKEEQETNESVKLSELNVINDVINGLEILSTTPFANLEEAESEIKSLLGTIGLSFDNLEDGEIPLDSIDGENAVLSVFSADETVEDELEGDMVLKCSISEGESGVTVSAEIMVYFEDGEAVALTDVEFEVEKEDGEEAEDEMEDNLEEEFETGKVFNVILFKPTTRRFLSSIIHANSVEEVEKIVSEEMPLYVVHSINPIEVTDTTK
jgi:hypothetical protein